MSFYLPGFEENEDLRSAFIRDLILQQIQLPTEQIKDLQGTFPQIPRRLVRYWHDLSDLPDDVCACLNSWNSLVDEGFEFHMFDDISAATYIGDIYGDRECLAFSRCAHPAMRCDYLRMCFILEEGGFYVDADDVLIGDGWRHIFRDGKLKIQPLCYDIGAGAMMPASEIWCTNLHTDDRIFYVNNDPIAAPAGHPVLRRALIRATEGLLGENPFPEIQTTTGPGNFTAALAAHAHHLQFKGLPIDFELLRDWEAIAEIRWDLSYRKDARNWRNVYGC